MSARRSISNDPIFRQKHAGVPDGSEGSDGTWHAFTENYTLPFAQATGRVANVPPVLGGDVYASSERHVCYTLRRGCSYAEAVYKMPGDRRQAWEHLESHSCIQFVFLSMYLCGNVSIYLPIYTRYIWTGCGQPNIYSPSPCPPPLPLYLRTTAVAP